MLTPDTLTEHILAERDKGNAVLVELDGLYTVPISTLVDQPADGILYDLNRLEEVALTFLPKDVQWVNNFAVALVVRELKTRIEALEKAIKEARVVLVEANEIYYERRAKDVLAAALAGEEKP